MYFLIHGPSCEAIKKFTKWIVRLQKEKKEEIELSTENQKILEFQNHKKDLLKSLRQYQALVASLFAINTQNPEKTGDNP